MIRVRARARVRVVKVAYCFFQAFILATFNVLNEEFYEKLNNLSRLKNLD